MHYRIVGELGPRHIIGHALDPSVGERFYVMYDHATSFYEEVEVHEVEGHVFILHPGLVAEQSEIKFQPVPTDWLGALNTTGVTLLISILGDEHLTSIVSQSRPLGSEEELLEAPKIGRKEVEKLKNELIVSEE